MNPRKVRKFWQFIYDAFLFIQVDVEAIKSINQKGNNLVSEDNALSNLKLHFTTTRCSTFSGFNFALLGVTTLPATEKTCSDLDEAAGTGKITLTSLARRGNWDSWCFHHSRDDLWGSPLVGLYLHRRHFAVCNGTVEIVSKVSLLEILQTLDAGRFF